MTVARPEQSEPEQSDATTRPRRKVLMVTGIFPPHATVGVVRSLKFSKYLHDFGWDAEVLAYRPRSDFEQVDEALVREIPPYVKVHRTRWLDPRLFTSFLKGFGRKKRATVKAPIAARPVPEAAPIAANPARKPGFYQFIRNLPDNTAMWLPFAVIGGLAAARRCDCIYSSAPPFTVHLVALWLHRLTGKPLVTDFRDPWIGNEAIAHFGPRHFKLHERWERAVIRASSSAINVTTQLRDKLAARFPSDPPEKFATIFNGFDDAESSKLSEPLDRTEPGKPLTMVYFGTLYGTRTPTPLLDTIGLLLASGSIRPTDISIRLVGPAPAALAADIQRRGLAEIVTLEGKKPRDIVLREMGQTGVLLQIGAIDMDTHSLSTKIFEYLAARRPILAMVPEGPIADIVRSMSAGRVASPDQPDRIAVKIMDLLRIHKSGGIPKNPPPDLSLYTRRRQAGQLATLLDKAVEDL